MDSKKNGLIVKNILKKNKGTNLESNLDAVSQKLDELLKRTE